MDISKYTTISDAAKELGVSLWWAYRLAKKYKWSQAVILGKRVYLKRDVKKTPNSKQRRSEGQHRRYQNKKSETSSLEN